MVPNSVICIYRRFVGRQNVKWLAPLPPKCHNDVILEKIVWRRPLTVCSAKLQCMCTWEYLLYSGNFRGRKLSRILQFCGEFSLQNFGAWCRLAQQKRAIRESFLRGIHQFTKLFSLKTFPLYGSPSNKKDFTLSNIKPDELSTLDKLVFMQSGEGSRGHKLCRPFIRLWILF